MLACGLCVAAILFYYYIHARTYFVSVERPRELVSSPGRFGFGLVGVGLEFWCLRALKVGPQPL